MRNRGAKRSTIGGGTAATVGASNMVTLRRFPSQLRKVTLIALAQYDDGGRGKFFQHGAIGMAEIDHANAAGVVRGDTQGAQIKVCIAELRAHFVAKAAAAHPIREGVDRQF